MKKRQNKTKRRIQSKKHKIRRISKEKCIQQTTKKYVSRPSPPYHASSCLGKIKKGNDGLMYVSRIGINYSPARWMKYEKSSH